MFGLEGKNVLVLGGGQGMGESTSLRLAGVGANVAVADLETERAERVAADVAAVGVRALPVVGRRHRRREPRRRGRAGRARARTAPRDGHHRGHGELGTAPRHDVRALGSRSSTQPPLLLRGRA